MSSAASSVHRRHAQNGNATNFQPNPTDRMHYLPAPWTGADRPASLRSVTDRRTSSRRLERGGESASHAVDPPLFLFLE